MMGRAATEELRSFKDLNLHPGPTERSKHA
jgi:hypothetical protein